MGELLIGGGIIWALVAFVSLMLFVAPLFIWSNTTKIKELTREVLSEMKMQNAYLKSISSQLAEKEDGMMNCPGCDSLINQKDAEKTGRCPKCSVQFDFR